MTLEMKEVLLPEGKGYKIMMSASHFTPAEMHRHKLGLPLLVILVPSVVGLPILFFLGRSWQPLTYSGENKHGAPWITSRSAFPLPDSLGKGALPNGGGKQISAYLTVLPGRPLMDRFATDFLLENPGMARIAEI